MDKDFLLLVDTKTIQFTDGQTGTWVHALPLGNYVHPTFGKLDLTVDKIKAFAASVKNKVRGIDPSINIMHGENGGGDGPAAGWVTDAEDRPDGLWVRVNFNEDTKTEIKAGKWRYFSAEYKDKWTDPTGKEHQDVFIGGALTNRPYMKNLLPINLSEATIETAIELAELVAKGKADAQNQQEPQEVDMELTKLVELLGLPAETTEEQLLAQLAELKPKTTTDPKVTKAAPTVPTVNISEDLRKLSEDNPMVKALLETVDSQNKALADFNVQLREADVDRRLAEFDKSKIVLTPAAKDLVHDFAMDLPIALSERFWEILEKMRNSSSLMVELGERAGTSVRYGRAKDPAAQFMELATQLAQDQKINLVEAMEQAAKDNPKLYNEYRNASFAFRE